MLLFYGRPLLLSMYAVGGETALVNTLCSLIVRRDVTVLSHMPTVAQMKFLIRTRGYDLLDDAQ